MEENPHKLHYESNRYTEKYECRECRSTNVYTRIYFHEKSMDSCYLCYYCATNRDKFRDYKLLEVNVTYNTNSPHESKK